MMEVTPGWRFVSIGSGRTSVAIQGIDLWSYERRWVSTHERIVVSHPSHPTERHTMFVYTLEINGKTITFAAGEYSNGVSGFYEPA
jgi:hypothetical protein